MPHWSKYLENIPGNEIISPTLHPMLSGRLRSAPAPVLASRLTNLQAGATRRGAGRQWQRETQLPKLTPDERT